VSVRLPGPKHTVGDESSPSTGLQALQVIPMTTSSERLGHFNVHVSRRTSLRYFYDPETKMSVWPDDALPAGWGWGREGGGDSGPRFYINLFTRAKQHEVPTFPASAGAVDANRKRRLVEEEEEKEEREEKEKQEIGRHEKEMTRKEVGGGLRDANFAKRNRLGGAAASAVVDGLPGDGNSLTGTVPTQGTGVMDGVASQGAESAGAGAGAGTGAGSGRVVGASVAFPEHDPCLGDSPLLALVRQEWLSWHHRRLATVVAAHWPLSGDTKTVRSCREEGLLPGLQGLHARFIAGQQRRASVVLDPLVPYAPEVVDQNVVKELAICGMAPATSLAVVTELSTDMGIASRACGEARQALAATPVRSAAGGATLPLGGTLTLVPFDERGGSGGSSGAGSVKRQVMLVFEPGHAEVECWLQPVRAAAPVEVGKRPFGPLNMPLYDTVAAPAVAAALRHAGVRCTPFTSVLLLNAQHFHKLALEYRMSAAGVMDPSLLPPKGSRDCLLQATCLQEALAAGRGAGSTSTEDTAQARALFLQRLYCVVARYEAFAGNTSGLQGALPHHVFDALERVCGVNQECFASPLNCHFPVYCSAFPDTDKWFGSRGSFFTSFHPTSGCFEANPPFVNDTMLAMVRHLEVLLVAAAAGHTPLLFFVIVPSWSDAAYFALMRDSPFLRGSSQLARKGHEYIDGLQHRAQRCTWGANVDSTWFVLATEEGAAAHWDAATGPGRLLDAFRQQSTKVDPPTRVFKFAVEEPPSGG
jgi:hypothetical protein